MFEFFIFEIIALLLALTFHEAAHAWMANELGDPTARLMGRLTLNPIKHLDPIGTLAMILTGFRFGWGKPVQFDPYNLANPKRDSALISIAGPVSNLVTASVASIVLRFLLPETSVIFSPFLTNFVIISVALASFNLLPIHPLDGGKVLVALLPDHQGRQIDLFMQRYGLFVLIFLIMPIWGGASPISIIIFPIMRFFLNIFLPGIGTI